MFFNERMTSCTSRCKYLQGSQAEGGESKTTLMEYYIFRAGQAVLSRRLVTEFSSAIICTAPSEYPEMYDKKVERKKKCDETLIAN